MLPSASQYLQAYKPVFKEIPMSGSDDVAHECEIDNDLKEDDRCEDHKGSADTIICTVTVQSSSDWWSRSLTIPG